MLTKEQERKALEQIEKILSDLGSDSYVSKAFEGCVMLAATNIDCDWWDSFKDQRDSAQRHKEELVNENRILSESLKEKEKQINQLTADLKEERETRIRKHEETDTLGYALLDAKADNKQLKEENDQLNQEIIRLKAKLYDLLIS